MLPMSRPAPQAPRRPDLAFTFSHPAHALALGMGSGLAPKAPGTAGTLFAWASWLLLASWLPAQALWWLLLLAIPLGWWACTVTAQHMRVADPGHIVWDEVVAMWIILWLCMPMGFWGQLICFALFRFFDAVKRGPVGWADAAFHGRGARSGFGIMFDDLVAAFCTLLVLALWRWIWP